MRSNTSTPSDVGQVPLATHGATELCMIVYTLWTYIGYRLASERATADVIPQVVVGDNPQYLPFPGLLEECSAAMHVAQWHEEKRAKGYTRASN